MKKVNEFLNEIKKHELIGDTFGLKKVISNEIFENEELVKKLLEYNKKENKLKEDFKDLFFDFCVEYEDNEEIQNKLDNYIEIFKEIFGHKNENDNLFYEKVIFAINICESSEDINKIVLFIGDNFSFSQLVSEYINEDNLKKYFGNYPELKEFFELENKSFDLIFEKNNKGIIEKVFKALKNELNLGIY